MKIAVISDLHSNLEALQAVLKDIKVWRVDKILCCGDIIGYNANPNEVVELIIENHIPCVRGNHDSSVKDFENFDKFNQFAKKALKWTHDNLKMENSAFLSGLPKFFEDKFDDAKVVLIHGSPIDELFDYVYPTTSDDVLKSFLQKTKADILVFGHTHIPFIRRFGAKLVINPGSVGQPRDGINKASYCIIDSKVRSAGIYRVEYDIAITAKKIIGAGLPTYLADRLFEGR
ncbi:metallophosphoesterase family protein [Candidatus Woesearchaeota archaeon]|nr:metallophosphoesterase family protein [Candidatus Woesearchaeota archaeon]